MLFNRVFMQVPEVFIALRYGRVLWVLPFSRIRHQATEISTLNVFVVVLLFFCKGVVWHVDREVIELPEIVKSALDLHRLTYAVHLEKGGNGFRHVFGGWEPMLIMELVSVRVRRQYTKKHQYVVVEIDSVYHDIHEGLVKEISKRGCLLAT